MKRLIVFDDKMKSRMGIVCMIPVLCFLICLVYYLSIVVTGTGGQEHYTIVDVTHRNYDTLFVMLAISSVITAPVFIYCLMILARLRHMNSENKLIWIIFLSTFAPIASALFWLFLVRNAPKYMPVYPDYD
jgi:hypothetical protein